MTIGSCVIRRRWRVSRRDCVSCPVRNPGLTDDIPENTRGMKPDRFYPGALNDLAQHGPGI